ncbi:SAM-dependent methyltransferase [Thioclava sp. L04-15]|uniref:methyltransferase domain-containing protein n=1 Tax=Thioclava sp. L04-15 TaxID=1915318 RepID=UPI00099658B6|nr:methyltransferase domain-containing protein [Thioclava sp. L04-15]OOY29704.1 SAM-dependent methyltransferase [Thioclava sp. L04-15]TNE89727.1 MAG: methyltransferase domain-containing protein [Paracoccaceae bacterium]
MDTPPLLTDREALIRHRQRAARAPELFLHEDAAAELDERLQEVNRTFTAPALIAAFPEPWLEILPNAKVVSDDEVLDLEEGAHDLVVHAMGLHWANDPVGQMVQAARALKPDGLFLGVMFGGQTLTELRAALAQAEAAITGGLSPRVLPMGEIRDLGALIQRAGFALPVADAVTRKVTYETPLRLLSDLRAMGETNALASRNRRFLRRDVLAEALRLYVETYQETDGRVRATFEMVWLTGWKPHPDQPKPLRPGSAAQRLADVLGTMELPTGQKPGQP